MGFYSSMKIKFPFLHCNEQNTERCGMKNLITPSDDNLMVMFLILRRYKSIQYLHPTGSITFQRKTNYTKTQYFWLYKKGFAMLNIDSKTCLL